MRIENTEILNIRSMGIRWFELIRIRCERGIKLSNNLQIHLKNKQKKAKSAYSPPITSGALFWIRVDQTLLLLLYVTCFVKKHFFTVVLTFLPSVRN